MKVNPSDLACRVLVVGDPRRAADAARLLQNARLVGDNREYATYSGVYNDTPVSICSHGVGSAGAAVCFTELVQGGAQIFIRAGTCGALRAEIEDGSLVIATAAIREDGTTDQLVPLAYPAVSSGRVVQALEKAAEASGLRSTAGIILTSALLYPGLLPSTISLWQRARAVAVEMELAALLVIANLNGCQAGGIFVSDGNLGRRTKEVSPQTYDPHRQVVQDGIAAMLGVALTALTSL